MNRALTGCLIVAGAVAPDHYVHLTRDDGHASAVNSKLLDDLGVAGGYAHVALSPDEKTAHVTGLARGRPPPGRGAGRRVRSI
ncbi:MAG: hypothetical protein ACOC8E_00435 [Planctomycetota bacterium]